MSRPLSVGPPALFWRACLRWVLVGLALTALVIVGGDPLDLFGPGDWLVGLGRALVSLPEQVALLLALAGFGGGFAVGRTRPPSEGSLRAPLIGAALMTYALIAFVDPLVLHWMPGDVLATTSSRTPLGPELPWTLWSLRSFVIQEGLGGGGPITPAVRSHLYGFSFYFPFIVAALGASTAWAGLGVGRLVAPLDRPAVSRSVAWLVWLTQAAGFYVGTKIATVLILHARWSAEQVALLPVSAPIMVASLLALVHSLHSGRFDPGGSPGRADR